MTLRRLALSLLVTLAPASAAARTPERTAEKPKPGKRAPRADLAANPRAAAAAPAAATPVVVAAAATEPLANGVNGLAFNDLVQLSAGAGLHARSFELQPRDPNNVLPVYSGTGSLIVVDAVTHPGVWAQTRRRFVRNIGAGFMYESGPSGEISVRETGNRHNGSASAWELSALYRLAFGDIVIRPSAGFGHRTFDITGGNNAPLPSVNYGYTHLGIDASIPLPIMDHQIGAYGMARRLFVDEVNGLGAFGKAEGSGYSIAAGGFYRLPYGFEAALLFTQTSMSVRFTNNGRQADESLDRVSGLLGRLTWRGGHI